MTLALIISGVAAGVVLGSVVSYLLLALHQE